MHSWASWLGMGWPCDLEEDRIGISVDPTNKSAQACTHNNKSKPLRLSPELLLSLSLSQGLLAKTQEVSNTKLASSHRNGTPDSPVVQREAGVFVKLICGCRSMMASWLANNAAGSNYV